MKSIHKQVACPCCGQLDSVEIVLDEIVIRVIGVVQEWPSDMIPDDIAEEDDDDRK